jgi:hypothetical protein
MPRKPRQSRFLLRPEIDRLRQMLIHLHHELRITREEIATEADVSIVDIGNFIGEKKPGKFKTIVPHDQFQRRILRYILASGHFQSTDYQSPVSQGSDPRLDAPDAQTTEEKHKSELGGYWREFAEQFNSLTTLDHARPGGRPSLYRFDSRDKTFDLLQSLRLMTEASCKDICNELAGSYYAYRHSSTRNIFFRSYVEICKFDVYSKTPRYISRFGEPAGRSSAIRISEGSIFEMAGKYIFVGTTRMERKSERAHLGLNLSILHRPSHPNPRTLSGFYVSCDQNGDYNVGNVKFVSTFDKFDAKNIGEIEKLPAAEINRPEDLAIDILRFADFIALADNRRLYELGKIAHSIKYFRPSRLK